jgi:hypothetical protein
VTSIALAQASGSPGSTTSALLATAECGRPAIMVEAAATGGTLPAAGLRWTPGVVTLAASFPGPLNYAVLAEHAQMTALGVPAVVGAPSGPEAAACMARLVTPLSRWLSTGGDGQVLVVDCGMLSAGSVLWPLPAAADLTVLVVRQSPKTAGECAARVRHTHALAVALAADGARVVVLVVGESPYPPAEIAAAVGVPVVAMLPWEPAVAAILAGGWSAAGRQGARFRRAVGRVALALVSAAESPPVALDDALRWPDVASVGEEVVT